MDVIRLEGIRAAGRHGANPGERDAAQPFIVDVMLELDLRAAEQSDDLNDTLDYGAVTEEVRHVIESTSFALLERLAGEIAGVVFRDPRIVRAEISIAKPQAMRDATPRVTLRRDNPSASTR